MSAIKTALGIIPARGGSKGVARKNIRLLAGRPLVAYTLDAARLSSLLTKYIVSTDDEEIATVAEAMNCDVLMRPKELATDVTPSVAVVTHVIEQMRTLGCEFDAIVLLQPTSPLRTSKDIDASIKLLFESGADAVVSVSKVPGHYHPDWQFVIEEELLKLFNGKDIKQLIPRRQLLSDTYTRNGAVYAVLNSYFLEHGCLLARHTKAYTMPQERSINIDSEFDFLLAESLLTSFEKRTTDGSTP